MFRVFRYKFVVNMEQVFLQHTEYNTYIRLGNWATFEPLRRVVFNSRGMILKGKMLKSPKVLTGSSIKLLR